MQQKLGQLLLMEHMITLDQLDEALKLNQHSGIKLGSLLVKLGYVEEEALARLLSSKLNVPYADFNMVDSASNEAIRKLSRELAEKYRVIPFHLEGKRLSIAMSDPYDIKAIDDIRIITGCVIKPYIAPDILISNALAKFYSIITETGRYYVYKRPSKSTQQAAPTFQQPGNNIQQPMFATFQIMSEAGEILSVSNSAEFEGFGNLAEISELSIPPEPADDSNHFSRQEDDKGPHKNIKSGPLNNYECAALFNILERKGLITKEELLAELQMIKENL